MHNKLKANFIDKIKNVIRATFCSDSSNDYCYSSSSNKIIFSSDGSTFGYEAPKGSIITKEFQFKNLTGLDTDSVFEIFLDNNPQNSEDYAKVEAYENKIDKIHLTEEDGILKIRAENGSYGRVKITVKSRLINYIKNSGTGDITGKFIGENLKIKNTGTGELCLSGKATVVDIKSSGTGDVSLDGLETEKIDFVNSGTGDLSIFAKNEISGKTSGTGDVCYRGVKAVFIQNTGVGDIHYRGSK